MRAIFIADAHLRRPTDENYRIMLRFLAGLPEDTARIFIMGDFFEFWLGDSAAPFPHYHPVLQQLKAVIDRGVELYLFEGNHDFHLGGYFASAFNATVFPDSADLTMDGKRIYLCHGDTINRHDHTYRLLRFAFRNPLTRLLAKIVPSSFPALIAEKLGNHSKGKHKSVRHKWDYVKLVEEFAAKRFKEGYDVVITAHFHQPMLQESGSKTMLSLGDWISQFSYGEWRDGVLQIRTYPAGEQDTQGQGEKTAR